MPTPHRYRRWLATLAVTAALMGTTGLVGCRTIEDRAAPSNHRNWAPDQAVLPTAKVSGDSLAVKNVRYCKYLAPGEYVVDHNNRTYDLRQIRGVDFVTMPFGPVPALAHTMVSFEFAPTPPRKDPEYLSVSVEVRKEVGEEKFNPALGLVQQYEIMYVVADERDLLYRQAVVNDGPVYLYRTTATPEAARDMLVDMLQRANQLADKPEFYNLLTNNCTTNIVDHVNHIRPHRIVYDAGVLLPGLSAATAYKEGLLVTSGDSFEQLQAKSLINTRARVAANDSKLDFSETIRR